MPAEHHHYKMSFAGGGLLLNESIEVVRLHNPGETWTTTLRRAIDERITSLPKAVSRRRILREIVNRVATLNNQELAYLVETANRCDQQALLWIAICRTYRFIREFTIEVIRERYLSYQLYLPLDSFDILFAAKAEWNDGLSEIRPITQAKLRQVLFRIMREAEIISDDNRILPAYVSPQFKAFLVEQAPHDIPLLVGLAFDGGAS